MKYVRFAPLLLLFPAPAAITAADAVPGSPAVQSTTTKRTESAEVAALRAKAERGNAIAQYNLGLAYAEGKEAPTDLIEAFVWLTLAAEGGSRGRALDTVLGAMTAEQIVEGRQRLDRLRATNSALKARPPVATKATGKSLAVVAPTPSNKIMLPSDAAKGTASTQPRKIS